MATLFGTITIGQAPRPDVTPIVDARVPAHVARMHVGLLDGMNEAQIAARYAPRLRERRLLTRLATGKAVELDAAAVETGLQQKLHELEQAGCTVILILCTGVFRGLRARRAMLVEPDRFLPALVSGLVGPRRVGVVMPLTLPLEGERRKWAALQIPPSFAVASPYTDDDDQVSTAARELQRAGADILLMDCFGFIARHQHAAAATGLPVLLSSELAAGVAGACLHD